MSEAIEKDWTDGQNGDKNGMRTLTKECGQPLYVGKSKKVNFTLDPPERNTACCHLDFSSVRSISKFCAPEM